jgi:hypothetical protein
MLRFWNPKADEVINRYFDLQEQIENLPVSSIAITPANYKFRFAGEARTEANQRISIRLLRGGIGRVP